MDFQFLSWTLKVLHHLAPNLLKLFSQGLWKISLLLGAIPLLRMPSLFFCLLDPIESVSSLEILPDCLSHKEFSFPQSLE